LLDEIIVPAATSLFVGLLLLFVEYKTSWFANQLAPRLHTQFEEKISISRLELNIMRTRIIIGTLIVVVPITIVVTSMSTDFVINTLQAKLALYEQTEAWNLPETITHLARVSEEISLTLDERNRLSYLEEKVVDLEQVNKTATEQIAQLKSENSHLRENIHTLKQKLFAPDEIQVEENSAASLVANECFLSVVSIDEYHVHSYINNKLFILSVGQQKTAHCDDVECQITLTNINTDQNTAHFSVLCKSRQP